MDTTPLIAEVESSRDVGIVRSAVLACKTLAAAACVSWIATSHHERLAYLTRVQPTQSLAQQLDYEPHCPSVPPREWNKIPEKGSAHMLVFGDSTDKLWHTVVCSSMLPEAQRCQYTDPTPPSWGLPNNMQPFACVSGDSRCSEATCYPRDEGCWVGEEHRAGAACKPLDPGASTVGFTHIPETDVDFDLSEQWFGAPYLSPGLSSKVGTRVAEAVEKFADFTQKRPILVSLDVMFWWMGMRYQGYGNKTIQDPDSVTDNWDSILEDYRDGILGLVNIIQRALSLKNRQGVIVAKVNHNPSYEDGSLELRLHLAMREVLLDIFERDPSHEDKGLYLFDWYDVSNGLRDEGKWDMLDWLHQGPGASQLETEAYEDWTKNVLPESFHLQLRP